MNTSHSRQSPVSPSIRLGRLRLFAACAASIALCGNAHGQTATQLLEQAQKLYDQGNRYQASPLFAKAEQEFRKAGDKRDVLFAKFGRLHADADHGNYRAVKAEIERDLAMALVQRDPELKIEALSVLGTIDLNIDTNAAGAVWTEVLNTAIAAHDLKWENRAHGELGIFAGLSGNIGAAGTALFKAIATAEQLDDIGGAVNFMVWLANGMALNGMADGALRELDKATELAKANGYHQLPFELSIARLRAIAMLPTPLRLQRMGEARRLFASTLLLAEQEKIYGAEIDLLNQEGQIASKSGHLNEAEQVFLKAASVARAAELPGLEAEAYLQLARVYLRMHQPQNASASIRRGISEIRGTDEAYDFPLFVAAEADTEAALGHARAADAL